jgi:hypothetical protein
MIVTAIGNRTERPYATNRRDVLAPFHFIWFPYQPRAGLQDTELAMNSQWVSKRTYNPAVAGRLHPHRGSEWTLSARVIA